MKKLILTTIIVLVSVAGAMAQDTADVAVSADVNAAIGLTAGDVTFGTIEAGLASYLPANENDATATSANLGTTAEAGSLQITGTTGAEVQVSWNNGTLTDDVDGSNSATFTPSVFLGTTATQLTTPAGSNVAIAGGDITLTIGGALTSITNPGSYSTANTNGVPVTFTVQYTGA